MPGGQLMKHSLYLWLDDKMPRKIHRHSFKMDSFLVSESLHSFQGPGEEIPYSVSDQMMRDVQEDFYNTTDTPGSVHWDQRHAGRSADECSTTHERPI